MTLKNKLITAWIVLSMVVLACTISFGGENLNEEEKLGTAVAQTLTAKPPLSTQEVPTQEPPAVQPTLTTAPTNTVQSAPSATPKPCNKAEFVSETIADNTEFDPGDTFTKTWRFKNVGTCIWNTNYELVFSEGSKMGGPSSKNLTQSVAPGELVDFSVELEAPDDGGTYKGTWKVQDDEGEFFIHNIWVQIKVKQPVTVKTVTLELAPDEGGSIFSNGTTFPGIYTVGDNGADRDSQAFISFNISGIPSSAKILEVKTDFSDYTQLGSAFGSLGCLRLYEQGYRPFDAGDYFGGAASGALARWCNAAELSATAVRDDLVKAFQDRLGKTYIPFRLQFNETDTDGDNAEDAIVFDNMKMIVKYES